MGAAPSGGKGFKGGAAVSGERPIGAASCRQQHNQASCQRPPPPCRCFGDDCPLQLFCNRQHLASRLCRTP